MDLRLASTLLLLSGLACASEPTPRSTATPGAAAPPGMSPRTWAGMPENLPTTVHRMQEYGPTRTVARGGEIQRLALAPRQLDTFEYTFEDERYRLEDFFARNHSTGIVVVYDGQIHYERYREGNDEHTRFRAFSATKSVTSTLVGMAIRDGSIRSLHDPLVDYIADLRGTAYDGVTIKQALQMSSGVRWVEDYASGASDIMTWAKRMDAGQGANEQMKHYPRAARPGSVYNYSTGESQVLGWLVKEATGRNLADYLSERVWQRVGMEHDAAWSLDVAGGMEIGGGGLHATVRDLARFGLLILNDGVVAGERLLPQGWVREATTPDAPHIAYGALPWGEPEGYGYQWWAIEGTDRAFTAEGSRGQFIYVNPTRRVVIAKTSVWPVSWDQRFKDEAFEVFDQVSRHLASE